MKPISYLGMFKIYGKFHLYLNYIIPQNFSVVKFLFSNIFAVFDTKPIF